MANRSIEPIKRSTLSSMVTERLRELITQGSYDPGSQLSEVELASRFGVSRGPIREGLQRLVQEGLLRSEPHRGVFVPILSDADISDVYLARHAIEEAAIRALATADDPLPITNALRRIVEDMVRAAATRRWRSVADLDLRFHVELVKAARSPRLSQIYATLVGETRWLMTMKSAAPSREHLVEEHEELVRLLEAGQFVAVLDALQRHFAETRDRLREHERA
jgi:DNA-binding GntR family transcriptional regulator